MTVRRNILASWMAHLVTLVVGLFLVRYVKDTLGDEGYGAWILVNSIAGYTGLLYAGFGAAICRYTAKYHTSQDWTALNQTASSIFTVYAANSLLCVVGAIALAYFAPSISDWEGETITDVRMTMLIIGVAAMVGMLGSVFGGILIGVHRFDIKRTIQIAGTIGRLLLVVVLLYWKPGLVSMAVSFLCVNIGENLAYYLCARRAVPQLRVSVWGARRDVYAETLPFVGWNALSMISEYLIYLTDTVVIGCYLGSAAVTPYYIALRLCQMMRLPLDHVAEAALPKAGELHTLGKREELHRLIVQTFGLAFVLIGGFFVGSWYFGERVLTTWLGTGNEASVPILLLLVGAQLVAVPCNVLKKILMGSGQVRGPATLDLIQAVLNLVLSLILIRSWGVIGVAWGTLIPILLIELTMLVPYAARQFGFPLWQLLMRSLLPQIPILAALIFYSDAVSRLPLGMHWFALLGIAMGGGGVFVGSWWATRYIQRFVSSSRRPIPDAS
ncbi:MAG: MATE family efflux transporter [Planctomycetaceae bacterium]